ncbi:Alpha/Beta hydrolase protein [Phycomyces nitens]|nr:Alpha/Beta hydrolase protein [Phycomyces nitens]
MFIRRLAQTTQRHYSSSTVKLTFDKYSASSDKSPLVICHGLFGSKQNWKSLAKAMATRLDRDIYAIDLRNHGDSPHEAIHTYDAMSNDLMSFIDENNIQNPVLLGHSMGGKVVMETAFKAPSTISKLIVVDMPPVSLKVSRNFAAYIEAMKEIEQANVRKQSEADAILAQHEPNIGVRMFLLTNLRRQKDGTMKFRVPLSILGKALSNVGDFDTAGKVYENQTLFIAGGKSPYYPPFIEHADQIQQMFPNSRLEVVKEANHWVHAEQPEQVLKLVSGFLNEAK